MSDSPRCYTIRRLNPFLGAMAVVDINGARALSVDGRRWEIQVEAASPDHTWRSDAPGHTATRLFRFGDWSAARGLSRVPANPLLDLGAMQAGGERMVAVLHEAQAQLPFRFIDRFEHWQLDTGGRPLVLLASTAARHYTDAVQIRPWQAGSPGNNNFDATRLEQQMRDAAGAVPRHGWYERQDDGSATPLDDGFEPLPADAVPSVPLRILWPDPDQQARVRNYLHALAPQLLTLDTLDPALRTELEQAACHQALRVDEHCDLYPEVLQPVLLNAARVEARLRRTTS